MNESLLLKFAFFFSIIGIAVLFLVSRNIEINDTTIDKITNGETQETVNIKGTVSGITKGVSFTTFTVKQDNEIKIVAFSDDIGVETGDIVSITGKISEYKGKKEIMADKIEKIN